MNFEIEKAYEAKKYENDIYKKWEESGSFKASIDPKKEPYVISMPPPNATGTLHLGHAVMVALEDIMIRRARMQGKSALWIPGTDHAAIATQSVVEKKLQEQGIEKPREELGREKLLEEIRTFVEDSKDTIRNQIRKMGASCDWESEKYTLDEDLNLAVKTFFKYMFEDDLIYHGGRIVNWDPKMQTTVADDEIEYEEEKSKFYYFQYGPVVIGTARPETKFLDKVIVVHPEDDRYKDIIGKEFEMEWIDGPIKAKVIADECVDMKLGTGAMTITPAHSLVDFELAQKYDLEIEQIIDFDGKIREKVSEEFGGMHISEARDKIVEKLEKKGLVVKIDHEYIHNISVSYRGKGIIEPQVMKQWFIDVNKKAIDWKGKKMSIKEVMQDVVKSKMINIVPSRFEKTYFHWIDNLRDWCISRQIWWGHQIPMWYKVTKEQYEKFHEKKDRTSLILNILKIDGEAKFSEEKPEGDYWIQDPDTLDTWFSASLWTFSTLGWPEHTEKLEYFHPTEVLETGYDILFFWVARMILASTYCLRHDGLPEEKCIPFKNVYLHGLIRDRHGKKMSKSRPETCIDPLDMIDKYGTDALRLSLVIGSTPGNDMSLFEEKIAGYRNFINKIWNASRFALMNIDEEDLKKEFTPDMIKSHADKWVLTELQNLITEVDQDLEKFRFSDAGNKIYEFIWNQYCDWYLEISKGELKNPAVLLHVLKTILKLIHPFVPFVTEQLWSYINSETMLINEEWPQYDKSLTFEQESQEMKLIQELIGEIRSARSESGVEPAKKINATIYAGKFTETIQKNKDSISRLARIGELTISEKGEKLEKAKAIFIDQVEIYLPLSDMIDPAKEKVRIQKEIENKEKFIKGIEGKLSNKGFTDNAPKEVIEGEQKKLEEAKSTIAKLTEQLKSLSD
ncbi:valine--tRNA ligase [Candidatus Gracilibacteria bacterium]|nr:valine--tRNA ligase [Candidatus Gracilibacteria bacterium]